MEGAFMAFKKMAAVAAMVAVATPSLAFDTKDAGTSTMFYVSIPLDFGLTRKEQHWAAGLQLQGKREYQVVNLDSRMFNFLPMGGLEAKWIIAGVVAAGATVAVGGKDKSTAAKLESQQAAHQQAMASGGSGAPCPTPVADPCRK
jgi:hypothetical protein